MAENRTFTQPILIPTGTPAGQLEFRTILDTQYQRATGFAACVNTDGGINTFRLGLRDDAGVYASPTNVSFFKFSDACPKPARLTPVNIKCDNTQLTIQVLLPAQLLSDLSVDVIFQLEK